MSDLGRASLLRAAIGGPGLERPSATTWDQWVWTARIERVIPLLHEISGIDPWSLTPVQLAQVDEMQLDVAALSVGMEHALLEVAEILQARGVPYAVLKGVATAHLDYPDPSCRQFGDVDVLVAPADMLRARAGLEREGWGQAYPLPPYHERFTHAVTFKAGGITELDLHQRIGHRALGHLISTADLLECRESFEIAGQRVWALSRTDRLVHASVHAVTSRGGYRRLSSVADVLLLSDKLLDQSRDVLRRAESWRIRPLVELAIHTAYSEARLPLPDAWWTAMSQPLRRRDRLVDLAYLSDRRRPLIEELAHLRRLPRWSDRLEYSVGHLLAGSETGVGGRARRVQYLRSRFRRRA